MDVVYFYERELWHSNRKISKKFAIGISSFFVFSIISLKKCWSKLNEWSRIILAQRIATLAQYFICCERIKSCQNYSKKKNHCWCVPPRENSLQKCLWLHKWTQDGADISMFWQYSTIMITVTCAKCTLYILSYVECGWVQKNKDRPTKIKIDY